MTSIRTGVASSVLAAAAVFSTVALAGPASAAPDKQANPAAVQAVRCGYVPPDLDPTTVRANRTANIRTGPSTRCTSVGLTHPGDRLNYHCYVQGQGGTWTYLRNVTTRKKGWVKDSFLPGNGSSVFCR